ncbi:MAG: succinate dehydrogenase, hydrophobic membrane anchor protein, partial [Gammaproteobacteria bacterium]|nr:succinate dehydrogenase, hydrophobic membrane anchor protein [Gammaproteobacteria bacterium]
MSLKSPLGSALGLGSANSGTEHFWGQRLSAVALVPLTLWFAVALLGLPGLDYYTVSAW